MQMELICNVLYLATRFQSSVTTISHRPRRRRPSVKTVRDQLATTSTTQPSIGDQRTISTGLRRSARVRATCTAVPQCPKTVLKPSHQVSGPCDCLDTKLIRVPIRYHTTLLVSHYFEHRVLLYILTLCLLLSVLP